MLRIDLEKPPICTCFGRIAKRSGWQIIQKGLYATNMLVVLSGEATIEIFGGEHKLERYSIVIIPKGTPYSIKTDVGFEFYYAHMLCDIAEISDEELERYFIRVNQNQLVLPYSVVGDLNRDFERSIVVKCFSESLKYFESIFSTLIKLEKLCATGKSYHQLLIQNKLISILLTIFENTIAEYIPKDNQPSMLSEITDYIVRNIREKLTLTELSEEFGVSKQHIMKLFRDNYKVTVTEFINTVKLEYSTKLLKESKMNVSEVALYLGYSAKYFGRIFKEKYLCSPTEYISLI